MSSTEGTPSLPPTAGAPQGVREQAPAQPGWTEIIVAAVTYAAIVAAGAVGLHAFPAGHEVAKGLSEYALSAGAGLGAWGVAVLVRIRRVSVFGMRRVPARWLLVGAGCGLVAFALSIAASAIFSRVTGNTTDVQSAYQAAAKGGALALTATLVLGSVATPIGEEAAFRGVLANALGRYGAWVSVLGSAVVFALAHGVNPVLPVAFIEGVVAALLFRKTGSIWPGVFVHLVNNTLATIGPLIVMTR